MLVGISAGTLLGLHAFFFYLTTYLIMMFMFFGLLALFPKNLVYLTDLLVLKNHSFLKILIIGILFSMAGIPPLLGFFSKFYIIITTIESHSYLLSTLIILCSGLSAFYYLRIIKIVQFELIQKIKTRIILGNISIYMYIVGSTFLLVLFFVFPNFLLIQVQYLTLLL